MLKIVLPLTLCALAISFADPALANHIWMIDAAISGVTLRLMCFVVLTKNPFEFGWFVFLPAPIAGADWTDDEAGHVAVTHGDLGVSASLVLVGDELIAHLLNQPLDL